jgi:hypothetical protein
MNHVVMCNQIWDLWIHPLYTFEIFVWIYALQWWCGFYKHTIQWSFTILHKYYPSIFLIFELWMIELIIDNLLQ